MSLTQSEPAKSSADPVRPAKATGRDRRQHGRWQVEGAVVQIGNISFALVDISVGGFQMRGDKRTIPNSRVFEGTIVWPAAGKRGIVDFKARVVRVGGEDDLIAAAFEPLEGPQIDQLLGILTSIEAKWRHEREHAERVEARRKMIRRLVTGLSVMGIAGMAGYAVWILMAGGMGA